MTQSLNSIYRLMGEKLTYITSKGRRFCCFIVGTVFFLSGIIKLMDPVGSSLIIKEYIQFFHISFIDFLSKPIGLAFALAEAIIGVALITGVWRKTSGYAACIFQAFFTLLTLILVIFQPEMDCGCFGEAIHLTHWETFIKNIVLCALLAIGLIPMKNIGQHKPQKIASFGIIVMSVLAFSIYSFLFIPLVDFTDYIPGTGLVISQEFPESEEELYEAVFIYEKNGKRQEFDLDHLPDSTWTFVETQSIIKEEFVETTVPLPVIGRNGEELDSIVGRDDVMVISIYDIKSNGKMWNDAAQFVKDARLAGFEPIILTGASYEAVDAHLDALMQSHHPVSSETVEILKGSIYISDYKTLITLNRSNFGLTYFDKGYLVRKWAKRNIPDLEVLKTIKKEDVTETIISNTTNTSLTFQGFLLYVFAVMLFI